MQLKVMLDDVRLETVREQALKMDSIIKKILAKIYELRLYVAGQTPKSIAALTNLKSICEEYLAGAPRLFDRCDCLACSGVEDRHWRPIR